MSCTGFQLFLSVACVQLSAFGSVEMDKFSDRAAAFGFSLIQNLEVPEQPNLLISPASVQIGLGMAYVGATGETAGAMSRAIGVSTVSRESAFEELSALQKALEQPDQGLKLKAANAVWVDLSVALKKEFSSDVADIFKAKFERLRFSDPEATRRINEWVSDKTEGKISRLLEGPPSPPMFLADAVYFHAPWATPFPKQADREQPFHLANGSTSEVTMMQQNGRFQYAKTPEYEVVFLPYAGNRFGMYCFLPDPDRGTDALVTKLRESPWSDLLTSLRPSQGSVALPKFTVQYDAILNQALTKLGMGIAFDGQRAQFTRMVEDPRRVFIGAVLHKTFLEVNEEGSTAAAATGIQMRTTAIIRADFNLVFDRPFLVVIADRESGTILFLGIIGDPTIKM